MKIRFTSNKEIPLINVDGHGKRLIDGSLRDVLEYHFDKGVITFDELNTFFSHPALVSSIVLIDEDNEYEHTGYIIKVSISLRVCVIAPETIDTPVVTEEHYVVEMAQQTYIERQLELLQQRQNG